jgi:hypothetical protein
MTLGNLLAALCLTALAWGPAWAGQPTLMPAVESFAREAQASLEHLDRNLARAARDLAQSGGLAGPEAREALRALLKSSPQAIDVCAVDLQGRMVAIEPEAYRQLEGSDISGQEQVRRLWQGKRPVMSQVLRTVEGIEAVDMEHPVFNGNGDLLGSVSVLFRPEALLEAAWDKTETHQDLEPWAMDAAGRIIHDQDKHEVDRLLFSDDLYQGFPQLLAMGRRMLAEPRGGGMYSFPAQGGRQALTKDCAWATVELHGVWWRLVVARPRR